MQAPQMVRPARRERRWSLLPRRHAQSWEIYASLIFVLFYFAGAPLDSAASVALSAFAAATFLVLYFLAYWLTPVAAAAPIGALATLGAVLTPSQPGASVFLCYAASLACYLFPWRYGIAAAAAVLGAFLLIAGSAGYPESYLAINSLVIVAVAAIYLQARRSAVITERLRSREAELASIHRASERRRIAQDLHDQLGQHLVLIALKADLGLKRAAAGIAGAEQELSDIGEAARETLNSVRRVVAGYSARPLLEELRRAEEVLRLAGLEPSIDAQIPDTMTERQECFAALILREAATNVARHARASACSIRVGADAGELVLEVADNGCGALRYDGFGTDGMRERAAQIGGRLSLVGENGTRVILRAPLGSDA
jgi:two-component system sensor histidine kinase DesK